MRTVATAQPNDVLLYQKTLTGWKYALFEFNATTGVLAIAADGSSSLNPVGSSAGNIPTVLLPLSCMNLTMTLPMRATANVVSVDDATQSAAGTLSASDKIRLDSLAAVALTGAYGDLSGRPTIPSAQVNSDWNASSGVSQILNKPTSLSGYGILDGVSVNGSYANPTWLTSFAYSKLTGTPTLGTAAAQDTTFFASAAQGTKADSACQSGTGALSVAATVMSIVAASASVPGTMSAADFSKLAAYPAYLARSFTNNVTLTIQTVAAAGNGSQVSTTRDSAVSYSASVTTTSTIGGPQSGTIVLEVCSTNSSTAASWQEISRITNSQTITLAIALQSVQTNSSCMAGIVPAGFFRRLRSIATSGSPSFAYNSGQEVLL